MLLSPRAGPLFPCTPSAAHKADSPLNVSIITHRPTLVKNCRILRVFCAASGVFLLLFGLVRQFAGNFSSNLCVPPKMSFFGRLLVKNQKKGLYFYLKSGMLYPTKLQCWIHELLRAVFRSLSRFVPYFCYFLHLPSYHLPCLPRKGQEKR